jgi:hypothetical protein
MSLVRGDFNLINLFLDEIKWQVRAPSRYAIREAKMTYLEKVREQTQLFLQERLKHNHMNPA